MLAPGALSGLVISPWGPHQPTAGWASLRSTFISAALGLHPDEAVGLTVWSVCAQRCLGGPHRAARRSVLVANALLLVCLLLWRGSCVVSGGGGVAWVVVVVVVLHYKQCCSQHPYSRPLVYWREPAGHGAGPPHL